MRLAHATALERPAPARRRRGTPRCTRRRGGSSTRCSLAPILAEALPAAFERGLLDVPYCLHPDNGNETRCVLDDEGRLQWWHTGRMPLPPALGGRRGHDRVSATRLLADLSYHRRRLDPVLPGARTGPSLIQPTSWE